MLEQTCSRQTSSSPSAHTFNEISSLGSTEGNPMLPKINLPSDVAQSEKYKKMRPYSINYKYKLKWARVLLGCFNITEGEKRMLEARSQIRAWGSIQGRGSFDPKWVRSELERLSIRQLFKKKCSCFHLDGLQTIHQKKKKREKDEFSFHLINILKPGPLGISIKKDSSSPNLMICVVDEVNISGQAERSSVKINDVLYVAPNEEFSHEHYVNQRALQPATVEDIVRLTKAANFPKTFFVKRCETILHKPCMNTHNGSLNSVAICRALEGKGFPNIPCCKICNATYADAGSHHHLCPRHSDFNDSGAKEVLVMLLAGIRDGCEACKVELESGRKSKHVIHNERCIGIFKRKSKSMSSKVNRKHERIRSDVKTKEDPIDGKLLIKNPKRGLDTELLPQSSCSKSHLGVVDSTEYPRQKSRKKRRFVYQRNYDPVTCGNDGSHSSNKPSKNSDTSPFNRAKKNGSAKWLPCCNPWGKSGHCEYDFVLLTHSDYRRSFQLNGLKPKRFLCNPFSSNETYCKTHFTPQEGLHVLELKRDCSALRRWGFDVCHHAGGACLITAIEPLSPADAAVVVGHDDIVSCGLKLNDMVLCINGKKVGGMSMVDLEVELEISNSFIIIVVARLRTDEMVTESQCYTSSYLETERQELSLVRIVDENGSKHKPIENIRRNLYTSNVGPRNSAVCNTSSPTGNSKEKSYHAVNYSNLLRNNIGGNGEWEQDMNPWLGCVCGEIHNPPTSVFWIQCDSCEAWFNCTSRCLGFDENVASLIENWECHDCFRPDELVIQTESDQKLTRE